MFKRILLCFGLAVLFGSGLMACNSASDVGAPSAGATRWVKDLRELPQATVTRVEVVYLHRSARCEACLNAEKYTREALTQYFANQMKSGVITLRVLDMEKPENAAVVKKFDAAGSALYLSVRIQDTEYLVANPDIWFYTSNKYLFVDALRKKLNLLVGAS